MSEEAAAGRTEEREQLRLVRLPNAVEQLRRQFRIAVERSRQLVEVWKQGQASPEMVGEVVQAGQALRELLVSEGGRLPEEVRQEAVELVQWINAAIRCGEEWLQNIGTPQLVEAGWRVRLGKTYGVNSPRPL